MTRVTFPGENFRQIVILHGSERKGVMFPGGGSSGSSGRVGGAKKHEIYVAAFGSHLFYDLFSQGRVGGMAPSAPPWIRYWEARCLNTRTQSTIARAAPQTQVMRNITGTITLDLNHPVLFACTAPRNINHWVQCEQRSLACTTARVIIKDLDLCLIVTL